MKFDWSPYTWGILAGVSLFVALLKFFTHETWLDVLTAIFMSVSAVLLSIITMMFFAFTVKEETEAGK